MPHTIHCKRSLCKLISTYLEMGIFRTLSKMMTYYTFHLFKIRIVYHHSLTMILVKLLIGLIHGMCLLMKIPQNKHRKLFFSKNCTKEEHPLVYFKNIPDTKNTVLKHIGLYIDENFNYNTCIKVMLSRVYKGIGLLRNFSINFQSKLLLQYIMHL